MCEKRQNKAQLILIYFLLLFIIENEQESWH